MKNIFKLLGYYIIFLLLIIIITSILNLIGVNLSITNFLIFIFNIVAFFIFGYINGKNASNKGYLAGLKIGLLFISVFIIISLFLSWSIFNLSSIIYYISLILSSSFGAAIGINKKSE